MNDHILTLARKHAPCYLYEYDVMRRQVETLRQTFPRYDLLYSIKANPFPPVVRALAGLGLGADAASAPEVLLSRRCGMARENIFFSAAGKRRGRRKQQVRHQRGGSAPAEGAAGHPAGDGGGHPCPPEVPESGR